MNVSISEAGISPGLHIIAPGICGPLAETQTLKNSTVVNNWITALARSKRAVSSPDVHEVIRHLFKLDYTGDFPSAALMLLALDRYDPEKFYMHADPVHLQADIDQAILTPAEDLGINNDEAVTLCEVLNQHFEQDGLYFFFVDEKQWYVASENEIHLSTTALHNVIARNINFLLPKSLQENNSGQISWKQIFTEIQMLLHSHELNDRREREGKQSINSLWFHGTGGLPDKNDSAVSSICSNDKLFSGLFKYIGMNMNTQQNTGTRCQYLRLPETAGDYAAEFLQKKSDGVNVLHLPQLEHLVNYSDTRIWLDELEVLLKQWIYPLLEHCRRSNIELTLYPCAESSYRFSKYDALKFWKRGKLEQYVSSY